MEKNSIKNQQKHKEHIKMMLKKEELLLNINLLLFLQIKYPQKMTKIFLEDKKPINVLDYIVRRLVASSFYGSCNFQSSQTQQNNYNQITNNKNSFLKENSLILKTIRKRQKFI